MQEVVEVYLPLSRLLNLHISAAQALYSVTEAFLGNPPATKVPFALGIAGSVTVGKSTTARILRSLLARSPDHPEVAMIAGDDFLYANRILKERGLMKSHPEERREPPGPQDEASQAVLHNYPGQRSAVGALLPSSRSFSA